MFATIPGLCIMRTSGFARALFIARTNAGKSGRSAAVNVTGQPEISFDAGSNVREISCEKTYSIYKKSVHGFLIGTYGVTRDARNLFSGFKNLIALFLRIFVFFLVFN